MNEARIFQIWQLDGRTAVSTNEKNAKWGQKWSCGGYVSHFWNFGTP